MRYSEEDEFPKFAFFAFMTRLLEIQAIILKFFDKTCRNFPLEIL